MNSTISHADTPEPTKRVRLRPSNARGYPVGAQHHHARHPDSMVDEARALRLRGWTNQSIGNHLHVPRGTVEGWTSHRRRQTPVRVVVTLVEMDK